MARKVLTGTTTASHGLAVPSTRNILILNLTLQALTLHWSGDVPGQG